MNHKNTIRYRNLIFRISASVSASAIVMLHGKDISLFRALHYPNFYPVLGISSVITFGLISYVHYITVWLDKGFDWREKPYRRSMLQTMLGFLGAVFLAFLLMSVYFRFAGRDIFESGYMKFDFPIVVSMLLILNLYYLIHYLWATSEPRTLIPSYGIQAGNAIDSTDGKDSMPETTEGKADSLERDTATGTQVEKYKQDFITVYSGAQQIQLGVNEDVCFFYRSGRSNWLLTFSGETYIVNRSLNDIEETYCGDYFFRINRKAVIHIDVIETYIENPSRTLTLTLKPEISGTVKDTHFISVSQDKFSGFKAWFER